MPASPLPPGAATSGRQRRVFFPGQAKRQSSSPEEPPDENMTTKYDGFAAAGKDTPDLEAAEPQLRWQNRGFSRDCRRLPRTNKAGQPFIYLFSRPGTRLLQA